MLQVPHTGGRRVPTTTYRPKAAKKAGARKSAIEKAIADYYAARRAEGTAKRRLTRAVKKCPELEHYRPLVLICTRASTGEKVYGRTMSDCERIFPPSLDGSRPEYVELRKRFENEMKIALPEHAKRRRDAGIELLDTEHLRAGGRTVYAFQNIMRLTPASVHDLGTQSRFIMKELPNYEGGPLWSQRKAEPDNERWLRRSIALSTLETVLRAWAKL